MRCLVISNVYFWDNFKNILKRHNPEVVLFLGDTTDYPHAFFHNAPEEIIRESLEKKPAGKSVFEWLRVIDKRYESSPDFKEAKRAHADSFYQALRNAAKVAKRVFVIKGDSDKADYSKNKITKIKNCFEISNKAADYKGLRFLGSVGKSIKKNKSDIILSHAPPNLWNALLTSGAKAVFNGNFQKELMKKGKGAVLFEVGAFPNYLLVNLDKKISASYYEAQIKSERIDFFNPLRYGRVQFLLPKVDSWKIKKLL